MKILVIDNYDSFVFNIVYILSNLGLQDIEVCKNDKLDLQYVDKFDKIVLSPGPGVPRDAGLMPEIIKKYAQSKSILGICLGHQAIAENFGGTLINMPVPLHGVSSPITICKEDYLLAGIPNENKVGNYHSWVVQKEMPEALEILATDERGHIMAIRHKEHDLRGLQFHPESILTENGIRMIKNWVEGK